jgi:hypothetical protein
MHWWDWTRAQRALETWVRVLIGARPYAIRFGPREGSFVRFDTQEIVVDPLMVDGWGGARWLPATWRGYHVTELPGLQWRVARALARHEAGHVLFTAAHTIHGGLHAWLTNALEDQRMERLTGALAPAARADFLALARLLAAHLSLPDPTLLPRADTLLNACLFWRWDTHRPAGTPSRLRLASADDQLCWETAIRPLVEDAWAAPDVQHVSDIALAILRHLDLPDRAGADGHVLIAADAIRHPAERRAGDVPLHIPGTIHVVHSNGLGDGSAVTADAVDVVGTETVDEGESPTVDTDPSSGSLWLRPYAWLVQEVAGETRRLLRVLQVPAPAIATRRSTTSGTFSARAYARTGGERPLIVRREPSVDSSGLAIVLLIDRTTSMGEPPTIDRATGEPSPNFFDPDARMPHARRAAMLFELTCTQAGIPLCIGFAGDRGYSVHLPHAFGERVFFHRPERPITWLRTWETPRFAEGPTALIAGLYGDSYSERVSASLHEAHAKLQQRPEGTKLILFIHDGLPTDEPASAATTTVDELRRRGTHIIGVFVGDQAQLPQLEAIFGAPHTIPVTTVADLPQRLGRLLLTYRTHQRRN